MGRRAEQAARCPWCAGPLRRGATECPECLFPLTMAAVDGGRRIAGEPRGTSSTASPSGTPSPRFHLPAHSLSESRRSHRLRLIAWLLALTAGLLLVAGVASWISVANPGARADTTAQRNLYAAMARARGENPPTPPAEELPGDTVSDSPAHLSITTPAGTWFGAARSTSGRCYVLAWRFDGVSEPLGGTLGKDEPCSGDQAQRRLGRPLADARPKKRT